MNPNQYSRMVSTLHKVVSIQFLRGFAAISVVIFHASSLSGISNSIGFLAAGVDIFFIISGIVMCLSISENTNAANFLWRRFVRVVPMYWIFTALAVFYSIYRYRITPPLEHTLSSFFFLPPSHGTMPILYPGWSLNFEFFFYLILSIFIMSKLPILSAVIVIAGISAVGPMTDVYLVDYYLSSHLAEFSAGLVVGLAIKRNLLHMPSTLSLTCVIVGCVALALQPQPHSAIGFSWGVPSLLIVCGTLAFEKSKVVNSSIASWLGAASYSIYLSHPFVIWLYGWYFGEKLNLLHMPILISLSIIIGMMTYIALERPLLNITNRTKRVSNEKYTDQQTRGV